MAWLRSRMVLSCSRAPTVPINRHKALKTNQCRPAWGKFTRISYSKTAISQGTPKICRKDGASLWDPKSAECPRNSPKKIASRLDSICPGHWITLSAKTKTGHERTTIGNELRTGNCPSPCDSTSASDDPCAVVVYADAAGRGSHVGLGAGTTGQT